MDIGNASLVTEFILVGLTNHPESRYPCSSSLLGNLHNYGGLGNLGLVTLIRLTSHLHTPMYYFLFNLSCIDLCYLLSSPPKLLVNFALRETPSPMQDA